MFYRHHSHFFLNCTQIKNSLQIRIVRSQKWITKWRGKEMTVNSSFKAINVSFGVLLHFVHFHWSNFIKRTIDTHKLLSENKKIYWSNVLLSFFSSSTINWVELNNSVQGCQLCPSFERMSFFYLHISFILTIFSSPSLYFFIKFSTCLKSYYKITIQWF